MRWAGRTAVALLVAGTVGCGDALDNLRPDLIVTEVSAPDLSEPYELKAGTSTTVRVTVRNKGLRTAPAPFTVSLDVSLNPGFSPLALPSQDWVIDSDLPGQAETTHDFVFQMPVSPYGDWYLRGDADVDGFVDEANETNNTASTVITNVP